MIAKISTEIIRILDTKATEKDLDKEKIQGGSLITLEKEQLFSDYLTLPITDLEFQSLEETRQQGGYKEKLSHQHDFKVLKWEYFPSNHKARVYILNDL